MLIPIRVFLVLIFTIPLTPKFGLSEFISLYPFELFSPLLWFCFKPRLFYQYTLQRILILYFGIILVSTIGSQIFLLEIPGVLRSIKWFLYIPIFYATATWCQPELALRWFSRVGAITMTANLGVMISVFLRDGFNIWGIISSGFSNKVVSVLDGSLTSNGGAHGIFGSYCVLVMCVSLFLLHQKSESKIIPALAILLSITSILISVSREAAIVLIALLVGYLLIYARARYIAILCATMVILGFIFQDFFAMLPMVQKIVYAQEAISSTGSEINMTMRINTWMLTIQSFKEYPWIIFTGIGLNRSLYGTILMTIATKLHITQYVDIPESLFMQSIVYGGIPAVVTLVIYLGYIAHFCFSGTRKIFFLFGFCFLGLIFTNAVSGASLFSDLLYSQLLLIMGVLWNLYQRERNPST